MKKNKNTKNKVIVSSNNLFEDLGMNNPRLELIRARMKLMVYKILKFLLGKRGK